MDRNLQTIDKNLRDIPSSSHLGGNVSAKNRDVTYKNVSCLTKWLQLLCRGCDEHMCACDAVVTQPRAECGSLTEPEPHPRAGWRLCIDSIAYFTSVHISPRFGNTSVVSINSPSVSVHWRVCWAIVSASVLLSKIVSTWHTLICYFCIIFCIIYS